MEKELKLDLNDFNKIKFALKRTIKLIDDEELPYEYEREDFKHTLKKLEDL